MPPEPSTPTAALTPLRSAGALSPGMRVAVVAPSGWMEAERLNRGCAVLQSWGFEVTTGRHALDRHPSGFLSGSDADRAADLQAAWCDPDVDAVICARGGYGAGRLIDLLDWTAMRTAVADRPVKPFVGSSDVTALHQAFAHHLGISTYFGPMVAGPILGLPNPCPATIDALRAALLKPADPLVISGGQTLLAGARQPSSVSGVSTGGTLSMLCSLLGTPEAGRARGGILLLEDVAEAPYRIDRMLTQLLRSDWLTGVAGIACGSWERCGPPAAVHEVLRERLSGLGVPVLTGFRFGHGPEQATVPLGVPTVLDPGAGTLRFLGS
ncbi:MAG TPA: LD-carboxypeptidase [Kineosporiaceae bacterium]|nr:LD-carboxypeptidase [Kineosporiaceae bacterium]